VNRLNFPVTDSEKENWSLKGESGSTGSKAKGEIIRAGP
jgi:hypothetical protein